LSVQPAGTLDETGAAWTTGLHEILAARKKLPGRGRVQSTHAGICPGTYEGCLGSFGARLCGRAHRPAAGGFEGSVDRASDSRWSGDRSGGGEVPPPSQEAREEGPFGDWPGYYSGGILGTGEPQPVIKVKAVYHRNNPILEEEAPLWTGAMKTDANPSAGILWDQLESAGVQNVVGVYNHSPYFSVVAIKQSYAGHAKQAGLAAVSSAAAARNGRYVVVVDEDIDPTNMKEVLWAMMTRVDPKTNIDIIDGCWSTRWVRACRQRNGNPEIIPTAERFFTRSGLSNGGIVSPK